MLSESQSGKCVVLSRHNIFAAERVLVILITRSSVKNSILLERIAMQNPLVASVKSLTASSVILVNCRKTVEVDRNSDNDSSSESLFREQYESK